MLRRDELPPDQTHLSKFGAAARFLWNTGPWTKDDSFAWTDPKPFFVDLKQMIVKRIMKSESSTSWGSLEPFGADCSALPWESCLRLYRAVVGVWAVLWFAGDRWWFATLMLFGPRWVYAAPMAVLVPLA